MSAGASPHTPLGELTALPRPLAVSRGRFAAGRERREGLEEGGREGKRGE